MEHHHPLKSAETVSSLEGSQMYPSALVRPPFSGSSFCPNDTREEQLGALGFP